MATEPQPLPATAETGVRSPGILLTALVVLLGSTLLLLTGLFYFLLGGVFPGGQSTMALGWLSLAFAAWGLTTAVGLLRFQPWSRVSILVCAALCFLVFGFLAGAIIYDFRSHTPPPIEVGTAVFLAGMAVIGAAFLYFFNKAKTRAYFLRRDLPRDALARPLLLACVSLTSVLLTVGALRFREALSAPARPLDPKVQAMIGRPAPDFRLRDLQGNEVRLAALKGHVVLLDFWATWCGPCRMEMGKLETLSHEFANQNVLVVGVNVSEPRETVRQFIRKHHYTYLVLLTREGDPVLNAYRLNGYPTTVLVNQKGVIENIRLGAGRDSEQRLRADFKRLLPPKV